MIPFGLGKIVMTTGAFRVLIDNGKVPTEYLTRHVMNDWGDLDEEDRRQNEYALRHNLRLLSCYSLPNGQRIYIITEATRDITTILLPEEY